MAPNRKRIPGSTTPARSLSLMMTALAAVASLPWSARGEETTHRKQIAIVFRYDDYSAISPIEIEQRIFDVFRRAGAQLTVAVIPAACTGDIHDPSPQSRLELSGERAAILKRAYDAGIIDVAQHGYTHQSLRREPPYTEMAGQEYARQLDDIAKGKALLENILGTAVTCFVPPWNTYDVNTLRALEELRFSVLSSDLTGPVRADSPLKLLPCTCYLPSLPDAVALARSSPEDQPVIVVLFHAYDLVEVDARRGVMAFAEFEQLLAWVHAQPDVRMLSVGAAAATFSDLSAERVVLNRRISSVARLAPTFLLQPGEASYTGYAASDRILDGLLWRVVGFYAAVLVLGGVSALAGGYLLATLSRRAQRLEGYVVLILAVAVTAYALRHARLQPNGLAAIVLMIGVSAGVWTALAWLRRRERAPRPAAPQAPTTV